MRIVDEKLLAEFRSKRRCEYCGRQGCVQPHHLSSRGMGGATRLDVPCNLLALCPGCHDDAHAGRIDRSFLVAIVAARHGKLQDEILNELYRLRRVSK